MIVEKTIVIKYGGAAVEESGLAEGILEDIIFMKYAGMKPLVVHGGGPLISKMMKRAGLVPRRPAAQVVTPCVPGAR